MSWKQFFKHVEMNIFDPSTVKNICCERNNVRQNYIDLPSSSNGERSWVINNQFRQFHMWLTLWTNKIGSNRRYEMYLVMMRIKKKQFEKLERCDIDYKLRSFSGGYNQLKFWGITLGSMKPFYLCSAVENELNWVESNEWKFLEQKWVCLTYATFWNDW